MPDTERTDDDALLARFATAFPRERRPLPIGSGPEALEALYAALPKRMPRLPRLYERFLLAYQWDAGEFGGAELYAGTRPCDGFGLHPNHGGESLGALGDAIRRDPGLYETLLANGYFPFGRGGCRAYDPVCFALRERRGDDCPVVGIDHEPVLCYDRVRIVVRLAPGFRALVRTCIEHARTGDE